MKVFLRSLLAVLSVVSVAATANVLADAADKESVKAKIETTLKWRVDAIADSPVDGLLQISTENGLFYVFVVWFLPSLDDLDPLYPDGFTEHDLPTMLPHGGRVEMPRP